MGSQMILMLADDDADDTALFCEALLEINPSVTCYTAENGKRALEILTDPKNHPPRLIFLDINMPVMSGWECLKKIKHDSALSHIPVIMYSTSSSAKDVENAAALGALCMMTKPDSYAELKSILSIILHNFNNLKECLSRLMNMKEL